MLGFGLSLLTGRAQTGDSATAAPPPATSQLLDLSLEELLALKVDKVYGASKFEQETTRAPSSVSIIGRDEIQKQGYRSLADALRTVNGMFVTDDRNYSYLGFRGFNRPGDFNSRVLLLVDGHRMNDVVYDQGLYGPEAFLDVDAIERVEVIRGPSSSIYGNNAFFGVVNVMTRPGRSLNGWEVSGAGGANETFKAGVRYGKHWQDGPEVFFSGSVYDSQGQKAIYFPEFDSPTNNNGVAAHSDNDRAYNCYGSASLGDFKLSGGWSSRRKDVPTASYGTIFNDGAEQTTDGRAYADLKFEHEFAEDLRFIGHAAYDGSWYDGTYPFLDTNVPPTRYLNLDEAAGQWLSADWQLNWRIAGRHTLLVGGDYRECLEIAQRNYEETPPAVYVDDDRQGRNVGVFAQAEVALLTNLVFNLGGRYDYYSTFGGTVNPRLGLIWDPGQSTTFKALYGRAFRAPNAYELYYVYPGDTPPQLNPERISTYELVWEQRLPGQMRFSAAGYYYELDDLISQVIDPNDNWPTFQNAGVVRAQGLELALEKRTESGVVGKVSYAIQRAEDTATDQELSNSPRHMAKLNVITPLWREKLFWGVDLQYYSRVHTFQGNHTDDIITVNTTLFCRPVGRNLDVSATVYNVFDEPQGFSGAAEHVQDTIPLAGRSFRVKLTYRF